MLVLIALISALALAATAWRVERTGIPVDFTPQALFMDRGLEMDRLAEIERTFGREDNDLFVLVEGLPLDESGRDALDALHHALAASPYAESVDSLVSATVAERSDDGLIAVRRPFEEQDLAGAVARLARDPILGRLLVAPDGSLVALRVRIDRARDRIADLAPAIHGLADLARSQPLPDGARVHLVGLPWVRVEVVELMLLDNVRFVPMVAVLFAAAICLLFRRIWLGMAPLLGVVLADVWAMGLLMGAGITLNILSILVPTLVLVIGVADGIHLASRYREELARRADPEAAMGATLRHMTLACFLTTFTTAAGFGSLVVAQTRVLRAFGVHAAVAVLVTWVAVMLVVPNLLAWIPPARIPTPRAARSVKDWENHALAWVDDLVRRRPWGVVLGCAVALAIAAWPASRVRSNSSLMEMYREDAPSRVAQELVEDRLGGAIPVFYNVEGGPGSMLDPDVLDRMARLERALSGHDLVRWTASLAQHVRHTHALLTGEDRLPDTREAVAQELLLADLAGSVPLDGLVSPDQAQGRILAMVTDAGGRAYLDLRQEMDPLARELFAGTGLRVDLTGDGMMAAVGMDNLVRDLLSSVGLVFLVILGTMWATLRSKRLALVAALPNLAPLVYTMATIGLMGANLQTTNIVSFTVAIGLAVDDTIHFLVRFRQERAAGRDVADAISATFAGAGHAIVLTSFLLVVGFGVLMTSDLTSTRHFGVLSAVTMVAALLGDLLLLPALLHLLGRGRALSSAPGADRGPLSRGEHHG